MLTPFIAAFVMSPQRSHGHGHVRHRTHAQKPFNEEPGIRAGYADVKRAFETKNWSLFRSRVTSDFKTELPIHHVQSLRESVADLRRQIDPLSEFKAGLNIQQIKVNGSTAVVDVRFTGDGKFRDKKGSHKMHVDGSETDSLKKVGGRWVAYYVKIHDQSAAVDGHVVAHMP